MVCNIALCRRVAKQKAFKCDHFVERFSATFVTYTHTQTQTNTLTRACSSSSHVLACGIFNGLWYNAISIIMLYAKRKIDVNLKCLPFLTHEFLAQHARRSSLHFIYRRRKIKLNIFCPASAIRFYTRSLWWVGGWAGALDNFHRNIRAQHTYK